MVTLLRDHVPEWHLARYCNMVTQQRDHATRRRGCCSPITDAEDNMQDLRGKARYTTRRLADTKWAGAG
jgi:hypothetical protein